MPRGILMVIVAGIIMAAIIAGIIATTGQTPVDIDENNNTLPSRQLTLDLNENLTLRESS